MENEFSAFIEDIKNKTGIAVTFFSGDGSFRAGEKAEKDDFCQKVFDIIQNEEKNRTYFPLKIKGENFVGAIEGSGQTQKVFSVMIKDLAEKYFISEVSLTKTEFFKLLVTKGLDGVTVKGYSKKYSLSDKPCEVLLLSVTNGRVSDIYGVLQEYIDGGNDFVVVVDDIKCALVKFIDSDNDDYYSTTEFAEFLVQTLLEETGKRINVFIGGKVDSVSDLNKSYLRAVDAERMGSVIKDKGDIHSYKEYVLTELLESLPKEKLKEFYSLLIDKGVKEILKDKEMVITVEEFLENNLNISETARKLYLHRNTLTYRLDKIQKITGLDVRKFSDALTFRLTTVFLKIFDK